MDQGRLNALITEAELVADAAMRLGRMSGTDLLNQISTAKQAGDDATRETAYRRLQSLLAQSMREMDPITIFDLHRSWDTQRGFRADNRSMISFWVLSVFLLITVGYATHWYDRATDVIRQLDNMQTSRMAEQGVKLFNLARQYHDNVVKPQETGQSTLTSEVFMRALADLQAAQDKVGLAVSIAEQLGKEASPLGWLSSSLCALPSGAGLRIPWCMEQSDAILPASVRPQWAAEGIDPASLPRGPPANLPAEAFAKNVSQSEYDALLKHLGGAESFFVSVGLPEIRILYARSKPLETTNLRATTEAMRLWLLPALYGCLGAALFYMRRFMNVMLPNPQPLQVIYRVLFGGFAGIVFAWFWSPVQPMTGGSALTSLSAFSIAFLAGYGTDILFQLLDRVVGMAGRVIQGTRPVDRSAQQSG